MNKTIFVIIIVATLLLATFLTINIAFPQQTEKFYEQAFGIKTIEPQQQAVGKAKITFKKTED